MPPTVKKQKKGRMVASGMCTSKKQPSRGIAGHHRVQGDGTKGMAKKGWPKKSNRDGLRDGKQSKSMLQRLILAQQIKTTSKSTPPWRPPQHRIVIEVA